MRLVVNMRCALGWAYRKVGVPVVVEPQPWDVALPVGAAKLALSCLVDEVR